jgi:hypothetical protein
MSEQNAHSIQTKKEPTMATPTIEIKRDAFGSYIHDPHPAIDGLQPGNYGLYDPATQIVVERAKIADMWEYLRIGEMTKAQRVSMSIVEIERMLVRYGLGKETKND